MTRLGETTWENSGPIQTHKNIDCKRGFDTFPDGGSFDERVIVRLEMCVLTVNKRCIYTQYRPSTLHALQQASLGASPCQQISQDGPKGKLAIGHTRHIW